MGTSSAERAGISTTPRFQKAEDATALEDDGAHEARAFASACPVDELETMPMRYERRPAADADDDDDDGDDENDENAAAAAARMSAMVGRPGKSASMRSLHDK